MSKKQALLILTAKELFLKHGARRVTIEEICKTSGVSKRTFYKYFGDKWAIARAVLDSLYADGAMAFQDIINNNDSYKNKCQKILLLVQGEIHAAGSIFLEDLTETGSPLKPYFCVLQQRTRAMTMDFFREAQKAGHIDSSITMSFVLFMLDRVSDLLNHPDFVKIMPDIENRASELATQLFYGFERVRAT